MIAALYVDPRGVYSGLPGVEVWDEARDVRLYEGPWAVCCHPPCARWGSYWWGGPGWKGPRFQLGDDGGCFAAALAAVRKWGGLLEHPARSHAWRTFGLSAPPASGGWCVADFEGGWTCQVEQGHYGHPARKATWLYACGIDLPPALKWGRSSASARIDLGCKTVDERRRVIRTGICQRLSHKQRAATPLPFRDLLISIAQSVQRRHAA